MPPAKPVILHPLKFAEALKALLEVPPSKPKAKKKRRKVKKKKASMPI
jgi:hypothetical protein